MKYIFTGCCFLFTISTYSQQIFPEKQYGCDVESMSLESEKLDVDYSSLEDLYKDIFKDVEQKYMEKLAGVIMIQVLVDGALKPCCVSISNEANVTSKKLKLVSNINATDRWKRVDGVNPKKKVSALIKFTFKPGKVIIERMGVSPGRAMNSIASATLER
jgi:hypothetical protein